jgi:hypothetical protein
MAVQLITKTAYARHRGCDEKAVRKAVAEGRISLIDGKVDPVVADIQWAQNTRARADSGRAVAATVAGQGVGGVSMAQAPMAPENAPAPVGGSEPTYADYRARTEKATAERAERENEREAGRLVDADTVRRGIFDSFRALRDKVMAVGPRAAPKCVGLGDARDIERVMSDELRLALESWEQRMLELLPTQEARR